MKQYSIKPSITVFVITVSLYILAVSGLLIYFHLNWFAILLSLLLILWLYRDIRDFSRAFKIAPEKLTVNTVEEYIELNVSNNCHQFKTFNVYTNRSSIILKLIKEGNRHSLILLPDRFKSRRDFLDCRYQIMQLNQSINAS